MRARIAASSSLGVCVVTDVAKGVAGRFVDEGFGGL